MRTGVSRRSFLASAAAMGAMASFARSLWAGEAQQKLNFVFILMDDLGWSDVGCYGSTFHETPNIDQLAKEGMRFTQAYAACPVCSPTRASITTGKYPARLQLTNYLVGRRWPEDSPITPVEWQTWLPESEVTLAEILKSAGYVTGHIGKWHLGDGHDPEQHGFDVNVAGGKWGGPPSYFSPYKNPKIADGPEGEYLTDRLGVEAEKFIEKNKDGPFFLELWHYAVHIPLRAKKALIEKYEGKEKSQGEVSLPVYAAMVQSMDESVGRVMRKLEEAGIADRTVVIFTSDNGGLSVKEGGPIPTNNRPLRDGKGYLYEGGIRVPWIVKWPGVVKAGTTCEQPVISNDFLPTILEMAKVGERVPRGVDGVSLVPVLRQTAAANRTLYWHYPHYANQGGRPGGAVRSGDFKLIENYDDNSVELYNLREDLGEKRNLASAEPEKTAELHKMLIAWRREVGAQMPGRREK